jgi:hypothetical protein
VEAEAHKGSIGPLREKNGFVLNVVVKLRSFLLFLQQTGLFIIVSVYLQEIRSEKWAVRDGKCEN